ncbi:MAG: hypothetical protein ACFE0I_08525 [Elainellaceae cyanobacterium]
MASDNLIDIQAETIANTDSDTDDEAQSSPPEPTPTNASSPQPADSSESTEQPAAETNTETNTETNADISAKTNTDTAGEIDADIDDLKKALHASQRREASLEQQAAEFKSEIDDLIDQIKTLRSQLEHTNQLKRELEEAKRYIRELTVKHTSSDEPTPPKSLNLAPPPPAAAKQPTNQPATPAAKSPPPAGHAIQTSSRRLARPIKRPVSSQLLPKMSTEQLNGLPKMSTEQAVRPTTHSKTTVKKETRSSRVADANLPKPKLSDSEIGWFD